MVQVSRKSSKKKFLLVSLATLLLMALLLAGLEKTNVINLLSTSNNDTSKNGPSPKQSAEEEENNADTKQQYLDDSYKDKDYQPAPTPASTPTMGVTATQEGSSVTVLTKIQSVAEGSCTLTATNGSKTITKEAELIYQPEFSSCAGFSVPVSEIGPGTWSIKVSVTPSDGDPISKSTTIEVK